MVDQADDKDQSEEQTPDGVNDEASAAENAGTGETDSPPAADAAAGAEPDAESQPGAKDAPAARVTDENADAAWAEALAETEGADADGPAAAASDATPQATAHPADFPELGAGAAGRGPGNINLLLDVKLPVSIELGRTTQPISEILQWGQGSIVELDKLAGEPVNLLVNNRLVAKGEVVVVDENFGLRITSLISGRSSGMKDTPKSA